MVHLLYGRFPPALQRSLLISGPYTYGTVVFGNILGYLFLQRGEIPADGMQAAGFLSLYFAGSVGLFLLVPLVYALTARPLGLVISYREAAALSALPWLAYGLCQAFSQSAIGGLQILALPLLLVWVIWPFGFLTAMPWTKPHSHYRAAAVQGAALLFVAMASISFSWVNRQPALQFPPSWHSQAASSQIGHIPPQEPTAGAVDKIVPVIQQMLQREGLGHLQLGAALTFRVDQERNQAEFCFGVTERGFKGRLYVLFDLSGTAVSYELGRSPGPKAKSKQSG